MSNPDGGGGGDGGPGPGPGPSPYCPQAEPSYGDACSKPNLECEYGSDPRSTCNDLWICTGMGWAMSKGYDPTCPSTSSPSCPPSLAGVDVGGACGDPSVACNYSTSSQTEWCVCGYMGGPVLVDGGSQYTWQCGGYLQTGCPAVRPRIGTSCSQPDVQCDYGVCGSPQGLSVRCEAATGTWVTGWGVDCAYAN